MTPSPNPSTELELEAKNLLTKDQFQSLLTFFGITSKPFLQTNTYILDEERKLKTDFPKGTTLRLRIKDGKTELQLKLIRSDGSVVESKDVLKYAAIAQLLNKRRIIKGNVSKTLNENGVNINQEFNCLGNSDTYRIEMYRIKWPEAIIFFDKTIYPDNSQDYEIEVESALSYEHAEKVLMEILDSNQIPKVETPRKIERFYKARQIS